VLGLLSFLGGVIAALDKRMGVFARLAATVDLSTTKRYPKGGTMRMRSASRSAIAIAAASTMWATLGPHEQQHKHGLLPYGGLQAQGAPRQNEPGQRGAESNEPHTTKEQFDRWMAQLSNWGRWGKDDQLGAVNLITPAKRKQAAALMKTGTVVSLGHPLITEKALDSPSPFAITKVAISDQNEWETDRLEMDYHGWTFTHLDALCHYAYRGKMYNDLPFKEIVTASGCSKMGVTGLKDGIVTRAVLLDIPRLKGLPYLEPKTRVYLKDIEAWEKLAGVKVSPGDAILLRTGRWARRASVGAFRDVAGFDASVVPFLKERDVALVGSDAVSDVEDPRTFPGVSYPIHRFALVALGAPLIDNLDLETLAETAARLKRWEFFFMAVPVPVTNGSGSPINPIAVF